MTMPSPPLTPAGRPIVAWSYSALSMFENCPRKYWAVKVKKLVNDANQYNMAGDDDHKSFDEYLRKGFALPQTLNGMRPMLDKVRDAPGELHSEKQLCLDMNFQPCGYRDWNKAWVRGAGDVIKVDGETIRYFDWKRGKFRPNDDQIELTSLLLFQHFPQVQRVVGGLVFYREGKLHPHVVKREDAPLLWNGWLARVKELENAIKLDIFFAQQNPLCGWCPYGACQYNTNKHLPPQV